MGLVIGASSFVIWAWFIAHRRTAFTLAEAAQLVIELGDKLIECSRDGLFDVAAAGAGRDGLQARDAGFQRALLVDRAGLVAVLVGQMDLDARDLRGEPF